VQAQPLVLSGRLGSRPGWVVTSEDMDQKKYCSWALWWDRKQGRTLWDGELWWDSGGGRSLWDGELWWDRSLCDSELWWDRAGPSGTASCGGTGEGAGPSGIVVSSARSYQAFYAQFPFQAWFLAFKSNAGPWVHHVTATFLPLDVFSRRQRTSQSLSPAGCVVWMFPGPA